MTRHPDDESTLQPAAPLSAALADPDQSAGLQILADWYEEQGDARAEILRICVELQSLSPADPLRNRLMSQLWSKNNYWLGYRRRKETDIDCHLTLGDHQSPFSVHVSAGELLREGEQFAPKLPVTYPLCISGEASDFQQLTTSPILNQIISLGSTTSEDPAADVVFFASPHLTQLRRLAITNGPALSSALKSPHLGNVVSLALSLPNSVNSDLPPPDSALTGGLKRLELIRDHWRADAFGEWLAQAFKRGRLTSLLVHDEGVYSREQTVARVLATSNGSQLRYLMVENQSYVDDIARVLCDAGGSAVERLALPGGDWHDQSILGRLNELPRLRSLSLRSSAVGFAAGMHWSKKPLEKLQYLDLSATDLNDESLQQLVAGKPWPALETLLIHKTNITSEGMKPLATNAAATFPRLQRLVAGPFQTGQSAVEELKGIVPGLTIVANDLQHE